ncbi:MAG: MarR family transcriptional regulator [Ignavibacteriaceae bacterium]|nr:MarR family transcriptional regulator [Ignavibacteriaceae bacterium]
MLQTDQTSDACKLADLTFHLLAHFREKEIRFAETHGLTQAEFRCLKYFGANECMSNKQISERMKLTPGRLTRIIDSLIEKNYMMREIDKSDRRYMQVNLSVNGNIILQRLNDDYINIHREILSGIELDQQKPLITAMSHLVSALRVWSPKS